MITNVRVKTESAEQNHAAQKYLFQNGVQWISGGTVSKDWGRTLFVDERGRMTHGNEDEYSNPKHEGKQEMVLEFQTITVVTGHTIKQRPTTVLFGKTYYRDELNAHLESPRVVA